ncbi:antitoxin Xre/MbcA/ParS toxin-binding domain-containing protein [Marinobacter sp. GN3S48]|uniref:antitoxin Xre/MbcA/ParS toxin-binding domain-containing protein n=1 Tax=Marinobacter sp. GN3S48 TaxID=3382302 RepID=UPI00387AD6E0
MDHTDWTSYVACFAEEFRACPCQDELVSACCGHRDVACVAWHHLQGSAFEWLRRPIPALDNQMPAQVIASGNVNTVRSVLWRMPC